MSVITICVMAAFAASMPAHSEGFFNKLFGSSKEEPKGPPPEVTLQAPFPTAPTTAQSGQSKLMDMYGTADANADDASDLGKPHRNEKQIVEWTTEIVSQAMTINVKTHAKDFQHIAPHFTPYAAKEYQDYLERTNMIRILSSNSLRLQAVSDEEGAVVKEGAITGTYHWLVQIPLMTSFYNEDIQSVDKTVSAQNQNLMVQVQVGRVLQKTNAESGLVIERWNVSSNAKK